MSGRGKRSVSYVQNDEPAFIKQFKQRVGYKEGPNIDTKRRPNLDDDDDDDDDDTPERDDEKPVVIVLQDGDLTEEEAEKAKKNLETGNPLGSDSSEAASDGKIVFKKPIKRSNDGDSELTVTSSKKKKDSENKKHKKSSVKKIKNSKLLSFDDEDDEEDG